MNTIKEVAELFRVTEKTIKTWIKADKIKVIRIGGIIRITDEEIERLKMVE